jgi:hypothetical protein
MNSFINYFFGTTVQCDKKLQFNNRMPFHSYYVTVERKVFLPVRIPAKNWHVLANLSAVSYLPVYCMFQPWGAGNFGKYAFRKPKTSDWKIYLSSVPY